MLPLDQSSETDVTATPNANTESSLHDAKQSKTIYSRDDIIGPIQRCKLDFLGKKRLAKT